MNLTIEDLDESTVEKLRRHAAEKQLSLQADLKGIIQETVEQRERWQVWRKRTRRIAEEIRQTGQSFPDTTALLREDRER